MNTTKHKTDQTATDAPEAKDKVRNLAFALDKKLRPALYPKANQDDTCPKCGSSVCSHSWEIEGETLSEKDERLNVCYQRITKLESVADELRKRCDSTTQVLAHAEALAEALEGLASQIQLGKLKIRKDFSLMNHHAAATKALDKDKPTATDAPEAPDTKTVCPNCGQWQHPHVLGGRDCINDCVGRGLAKANPPQPQPDNDKVPFGTNASKALAKQLSESQAQDKVFQRVTDPVSAEDYNAIVETLQATIESLGNQLMATKAHAQALAEALELALIWRQTEMPYDRVDKCKSALKSYNESK